MGQTSYTGGKNGAGVFQRIISEMPPHQVYIEPFLGSGAVAVRKRPAQRSYLLDLSAAAVDAFPAVPGAIVICGDGTRFLARYPWAGGELVYCDPPYLKSTRRDPDRDYYAHEFRDADHCLLLAVLKNLPCPVLLSGYASELYRQALAGWRVETFWTTNRAGQRVQESLWCNFAPPYLLHDYQYLGAGFRERERIKRKRKRWAQRLARMPAWERGAIVAAIEHVQESGHGLTLLG